MLNPNMAIIDLNLEIKKTNKQKTKQKQKQKKNPLVNFDPSSWCLHESVKMC